MSRLAKLPLCGPPHGADAFPFESLLMQFRPAPMPPSRANGSTAPPPAWLRWAIAWAETLIWLMPITRPNEVAYPATGTEAHTRVNDVSYAMQLDVASLVKPDGAETPAHVFH